MKKSRVVQAIFLMIAMTFAGSNPLVALAATPAALVGNWTGAMETPNGDFPILLHVSQKEGKLYGTLDSPDQGAKDLPVTVITISDTTLHFEVPSVGGSYDGKVNSDGTAIEGEWKGVAGTMPLKFKHDKK
jgi:hypothetical protein